MSLWAELRRRNVIRVGVAYGALVFAWAFEITPEGIKREHEVDRERSITSRTCAGPRTTGSPVIDPAPGQPT